MASLKDIKIRIKTVKSSQKITKAMKMVAASKLRRAKDAILHNRPYTRLLTNLLNIVASRAKNLEEFPLLYSHNNSQDAVIIAVSSNRGLCGAFNSNIVKATKKLVTELKVVKQNVKIICVGKKAYEILSAHLKDIKIENFICATTPSINDAIKLTSEILSYSKTVECYLVYNKFLNAVSQQTTQYKFLPLSKDQEHVKDQDDKEILSKDAYVVCEPSVDEILVDLIPEVIATNILHVMLENAASEHGARMTAMDNASRNAGDMLKHLTVQYNRTRQASITNELIEIISGAEAINN